MSGASFFRRLQRLQFGHLMSTQKDSFCISLRACKELVSAYILLMRHQNLMLVLILINFQFKLYITSSRTIVYGFLFVTTSTKKCINSRCICQRIHCL